MLSDEHMDDDAAGVLLDLWWRHLRFVIERRGLLWSPWGKSARLRWRGWHRPVYGHCEWEHNRGHDRHRTIYEWQLREDGCEP